MADFGASKPSAFFTCSNTKALPVAACQGQGFLLRVASILVRRVHGTLLDRARAIPVDMVVVLGGEMAGIVSVALHASKHAGYADNSVTALHRRVGLSLVQRGRDV